jgi:TRAP-type C4-dicarboxylate transport system permease large subunit
VGGLLFVTTIVARVTLQGMVRELWPFMWAQLAVLLLLSLVPWISTALPAMFGFR